MTNYDLLRLRNCAVTGVASIFAIFYFGLFVLHVLLFHFPSSPEAIINTVAGVIFGFGVILWCLSSLAYRGISTFHGDGAADWQRLELGGALVLIYAATIPTVVFLFPAQPSLQIGYLCALTIVAVGNLVDLLFAHLDAASLHIQFPYHCVSLGLLSLVPTIHVLAGSVRGPPALAVAFGRMVVSNALAATIYRLRLLDWMVAGSSWQPGLYVLYLVLIHSLVTYSKAILEAMASGAQ